MQLLTLVYDEALDAEVTRIFQEEMAVARYSKVAGVVGARMDVLEETGYATDRRNNLILVVTDDDTMARIVEKLTALRDRVGYGVRGVVTQAEVVI
jgi:hypothetical protein